jgi:hypothetical protein
MTATLAQTLVVTLVAVAAAAWIVWRIVSAWRPSNASAGCGSCPSHHKGCATPAPAARPVPDRAGGDSMPLHVLRRS